MNRDAVIGCDAVHTDNEWLRLRTASGENRIIPWTTINLAAICGNRERIEFDGLTEQIAAFRETHDSLWILYGGTNIAQVMIEKAGPARQNIQEVFARQLGQRWKGQSMSQRALMRMLMQIRPSGSQGMLKVMLLIVAAMFLLVLLAGLIRYLERSH